MSFWVEAGCYYKALAMVMISCKSASRIFSIALCTGGIKFMQDGTDWFVDRDFRKIKGLESARSVRQTASSRERSETTCQEHGFAQREVCTRGKAASDNLSRAAGSEAKWCIHARLPDDKPSELQPVQGLARRDVNGKARARSEISTSCFECKSHLVLCSGDLGP